MSDERTDAQVAAEAAAGAIISVNEPTDIPSEEFWSSNGRIEQGTGNPFIGWTMDQFIPNAFLENPTKYVIKLAELASFFINNESDYSEVYLGRNPIHPFLEVGGALRVQVPLPTTMKDMNALFDIVLGNKTDNKQKNTDKWRLPEHGFSSAGLSKGGTLIGPGMLKKSAELKPIEIDRALFILDGTADMGGVNNHPCPNFLIMMCSLLFQQIDEIEYGKRGRYGPSVCRRLLDGHAYNPELAESRPNRTATVFSYDAKTGMPYGYYAGSFIRQDVDLKKFVPSAVLFENPSVTWTLLLNYTFVPSDGRNAVSTTALMIAALLDHSEHVVAKKPPTSHLLAIHTDKCRAAKSTQNYITCTDSKLAQYLYVQTAEKVWKDLTVDRGNSFHAPFIADNFKGLWKVDESTVEPGDPGEEVPDPTDRFYSNIYPTYRQLVQDRTGIQIDDILRHGRVGEERFGALAKQYTVSLAMIMDSLRKPGSLEYRNYRDELVSETVIGQDNVVSKFLRINEQNTWTDIKIGTALTEKLGPASKDKFTQKLYTILVDKAKKGNIANIKYEGSTALGQPDRTVPRLTDFAYIMVGDIPQGGRLDNALTTLKDLKTITKS